MYTYLKYRGLLFTGILCAIYVFFNTVTILLVSEPPDFERVPWSLDVLNENEKRGINTQENKLRKNNMFRVNENSFKLPDMSLDCNWLNSKNISTSITHIRFSKFEIYEDETNADVHLVIRTFNAENVMKSRGGDFIVVLANQIGGDGLIAGHVIDYQNGTYTGLLKIPWKGRTHVKVKFGAFHENTCLRMHSIDKFGLSVFSLRRPWGIRGKFVTGNNTVYTACSARSSIYGYKSFCNFTQMNDGESWFCGQPNTNVASCSNLRKFHSGPFSETVVALPTGDKIRNPTVQYLKQSAEIYVNRSPSVSKSIVKCNERTPIDSWKEIFQFPSGYWQNNTWNFVNCHSYLHYGISTHRTCIQGKTIFLFGDSTLRQYADYFIFQLAENKPLVNLRRFGDGATYHYRKVFINNNANITYLKHAMPFTNYNVPVKNITGYASELRKIAESSTPGNRLVIIVGYHAHFQLYPIDVYQERMRNLVSAIKDLLKAKPMVKIFFKGPTFTFDDSHWFDNKITQVYIQMAFEEFNDIQDQVTFLDTWSTSITHETKSIHPSDNAFNAQLQQLFTYLC